MGTLVHLFSPSYLFNQNPGPFTSNIAFIFLGTSIVLILIALIIGFVVKKGDIFAKKASAKYSSLAWTMGLIGIILYTIRQINTFYLSAPILILIWGVIVIFWLILVLNYRIRVVPKRRETVSRESSKRSYLG
ncbi:hypothetical protein BK004_02490 [bacterium CG10_46_32]|nr:MAG: hypothetical protein BK004_02490 [bacterium CG10_46_32]PIR56115.1 MAG: hypothetical protein COU73_02510 [Parcubacteria group bacterium CG10_big_fil_rev_8_21_14_0_10_46_32]